MKNIAILGSTGSIGTQTLDVISRTNDFKVTALIAGNNAEAMERQAREFRPGTICMYDEKAASDLKTRLSDLDVRVLSGMAGIKEAVCLPENDIVVTAVVGMIGIEPTISAIQAGKDIALANKETMVTAGHLITRLAKENNVRILPVDSEHSAIFQSLNGEDHGGIRKIILTASGGPFRGKKREELKYVTAAQALNHPNWKMGKKITIDSATMVNKGLEVIEARWLFDVDASRIQIVVQPQSVLHSAVEFNDRAIIGQFGTPDMRIPIQYALYYPERHDLSVNSLDLFETGSISFEKPDLDTFKGPAFAYDAIRTGGSMPTVLNAANEKAVAMFLRGDIKFLDIYDIIEDCMSAHSLIEDPDLAQILETEQWTYEHIRRKF
ncbi:MAG: 1-deoxy-D-xylulose-5-phosphate reductoisomerase [Lachnospiraceae bacterium]|nr:1-deoxy-D-xylulose-5-phosphate reductoisomerase [Lachnospiraceae bacterium]